jgi:hypothetical protein
MPPANNNSWKGEIEHHLYPQPDLKFKILQSSILNKYRDSTIYDCRFSIFEVAESLSECLLPTTTAGKETLHLIFVMCDGKPKQRAWEGLGEKSHRKHSKGRRGQICLGKSLGWHVRKNLARHYFARVFMVF